MLTYSLVTVLSIKITFKIRYQLSFPRLRSNLRITKFGPEIEFELLYLLLNKSFLFLSSKYLTLTSQGSLTSQGFYEMFGYGVEVE